MPARNSIKQYQADQYYHVYNRGVAKRKIFLDTQDYQAFLRRLQLMLLPPKQANSLQHGKQRIRLANFHGIIKLEAFCLMPNHFHFMVYQTEPTALIEFMRTLSTSYSMYFNLKYKRVGHLFQGRFKAVTVDKDPYLMHLSRYIHSNPLALGKNVYKFPYSSLQYYFKPYKPDWLETKDIESLFKDEKDYRKFISSLYSLETEDELYGLD